MKEPDDMWSTGGLIVFLSSTDEVGSGRYSHPPRVPVHFGDHPRPVYVYEADLRCPECDAYHDVPEHKPIKWLAAKKVLNDGLCGSCVDSDVDTPGTPLSEA